MSALAATPESVVRTLRQRAGLDASAVKTGEFERRARGYDASHLLLYPTAVAVPKSADEVAKLLRAANESGLGLTFRSGGTSLSGQAGTDKLQVDTRRHFQDVEVLDNGARVRIQPGVTVEKVNAYLAPYGRKFGPDPASSRACTIGGVVANNSSGMACGTVENTYQTLESLVAVLPSGTVIDTGATDADEKLRSLEPEIYEGLQNLRARVVANPNSVAKIEQQYTMKNTMGYGLNSYVDFKSPVDIFTHILIGSEGTLAFIASATFRTIEIRSYVNTALLVFEDLFKANSALPALVDSGAATLELMDKVSLRVGQGLSGTPDLIKNIDVKEHAALLLEYQSTTKEGLEEFTRNAQPTLAALDVANPVKLETDPVLRADLWYLRNGLYTSVAGARKLGTTALLEDAVVPVASLAQTCVELGEIFEKYGYEDSVIFGHAKDGNIHFMITDNFDPSEAMKRYEDFTEDMVDVILNYSGSLKAEHGTGRIMAPFVPRQWGEELYDVMVQTKNLFDPKRVLNDNTIITEDFKIHLKDFKTPVSIVEPGDYALPDRCVSCGYCEPVCPSRNLTTTPRQRIAMRREIELARLAGDTATAEKLSKQFVYDGRDTCAVCGLCSTVCPLSINTALLVKKYRKAEHSKIAGAVWTSAAKHWGSTVKVAGAAMSTVHDLGPVLKPTVFAINKAARAVLGAENIQLVSKELPGGGKSRWRPAVSGEVQAVYIPACVNTMFGPAKGEGVQVAFEELLKLAGIKVRVPEGIDSMCCGTVWSSKQITKGYEAMRRKVLPIIKEASENGRLPVICDSSSCTEGYAHIIATDDTLDVEVIDAVAFVAKYVLPELGEYPKLPSVTLHKTCSGIQIGLVPTFTKVAEAVADKVNIPINNGCCAFAGDRGMLHPELTYEATRPEAAEVAQLDAAEHASCNRTCELGLTRATGKTYQHILELLVQQVKLGNSVFAD